MNTFRRGLSRRDRLAWLALCAVLAAIGCVLLGQYSVLLFCPLLAEVLGAPPQARQGLKRAPPAGAFLHVRQTLNQPPERPQ